MADLTKAIERRDALKAKLADLEAQVAARPSVFAAMVAQQQLDRDAANATSRRLTDEADACRVDLATAEALLAAMQTTAAENATLRAENVTLRAQVAELEGATPVADIPVGIVEP